MPLEVIPLELLFIKQDNDMTSSKYILFSKIFVVLMITGFITPIVFAADGKAIYNKNCAVCHNKLSPRLGDQIAWQPHIKEGIEDLVSTVQKGKGLMPANAGNPHLSEDEIRIAVEYIVDQSK